MNPKLDTLLRELEEFGRNNDANAAGRLDKMRNITREVGEFLVVLIRAARAKRVLEIGTSNGYSTLWLAHAVEATGGSVNAVDHDAERAKLARANFARSGIGHLIHFDVTEAQQFLKEEVPAAYDFIFLDAERGEYPAMWQDLQRVLVPGGLVVADNATSHPQDLEPYVRLVKDTPGFLTTLVPVGKGEFIALKPS